MKNYKKYYTTYLVDSDAGNMLAEDDNNPLKKCLYCYETINDTTADFHQACNKKIFGQLETPLLDYKKEQLTALASTIIHSQMAVTGVQPKISLSINRKEEKNTIKKLTIVGLYGDYILKPPSDYYLHLPEVEHATMMMANVCGLKTVPNSLVYLKDGTLCYITKRIDRTKKGKLHMEDMCQLTERLTEDKYKGSHEQIGKAILKYSANPLLDVINFYEVVIFCFLTGNSDMHLKNFSLVQTTDMGYSLSPAYDLVATALINPADTEELALTLNGKKKKINYNDFLAGFSTNGLSKKILDTTLENFFYCRNEIKRVVEKSFLLPEYKKMFYQLFDERCKRLLQRKQAG